MPEPTCPDCGAALWLWDAPDDWICPDCDRISPAVCDDDPAIVPASRY